MAMQTGLVLEGGGMRGLFTAGILDVFLEEGIHFDKLLAVSAGACHACSYLAGQKLRARDAVLNYLDSWRYMSLRELLLTGDLFGEKRCYHEIPETLYPIDRAAFSANPTDFRAVVTNVRTGKPEYLPVRDARGDIDLIRASSSLPLVSRIVSIGKDGYLDGGVTDPIPLAAAEALGCRKNIVVLTQAAGYRKAPNRLAALARIRYPRHPEIARTMRVRHEVYNRTLDDIDRAERAGSVFVLRPPEPLGLGRTERDRDKLMRAYETGVQTARQNLSALQKFLQDKQEE